MQGDHNRLDAMPPRHLRPSRGRTTVSETAVAKVTALAAHGVPGVHAFGSSVARSFGAMRGILGGSDLTAGVRVEVGSMQVAADISLIAAYGYPLQELADGVRAAVYRAVAELVGLEVVEVNVEVTDVAAPGGAPGDVATPGAGRRDGLGKRLGSAVKAASAPETSPGGRLLPSQAGEPS